MRRQAISFPHATSRQHGVIIIVVLVILLIMTIIGVSAMSTATLEERMAGNFRDRSIAFQAAEAALREAERHIEDNKNGDIVIKANFNTACDLKPGYCLMDKITGSVATNNYWEDSTIWSDTSRHRQYTTSTISESAQPPKYIIEFLGNVCPAEKPNCRVPNPSDPVLYRITALGYGKNSTTQVMLQSTYRIE